MKKIVAFIILGMLAATMGAKLNPLGRIMLKDSGRALSRSDSDAQPDSLAPYMPMLLLVESDSVLDALYQKQVVVFNMRDNIALSAVPRDSVETVTDLVGIVYATYSSPMALTMDKARSISLVDCLQQDSIDGFPPLDGDGVVTGFTDIGFDASNIAFRGRIRQIHDYKSQYGAHDAAVTPQQIEAWVTDSYDNFHATHVANIMAGGYMECPYYGVATKSDIVATTSDLYDSGILAGIEDIIAYGKAVGKPTVINMSLGSAVGPHDGSDLCCRYLSSCAKEAVICISSGNNGTKNVYATASVSQLHSESVLLNNPMTQTALDVEGVTDAWSADCRPFAFRIAAWDGDSKLIAYTSQWFDAAELQDQSVVVTDSLSSEWNDYFTGQIIVAAELSPLNNRFETAFVYDLHTDVLSDRGAWSKYRPVIEFRGCDDDIEGQGSVYQHIDIYADGQGSSFAPYNNEGYCYVSNDCSASNMAFADDVIVVGMYVSRNSGPYYPEGEFDTDIVVGDVVPQSSYCTDFSTWHFPHFCAPGKYVISALSTPYYELNKEDLKVSACSEVDGESYYWMAASGTSMSSPFAAGVMALWLQANPTLDAAQLRDIAIDTADPQNEDPRWGAGKLNPLAGLRHIIASTPFVSTAKPVVTVTSDRRIEVTVPGCADSNGRVTVYDISGKVVNYASPLEPGVYFVAVNGYNSCKILVK